MSIDCEHCHGMNIDENGDKCEHEGATWQSITVLNPDTVESSGFFLDQEPQYYMMPDEGMVRVVQEKTPKELYERIPVEIRKKILQRAPIYLDPISICHLKRGAAPWQPYGTSMVRRLFPTLAYKDKLRQAQWLVAERHIIPIKIVTIGSDDRPASDEDIQSVQEELTNVANDPLLTLVTHHNFKLDYIGAQGKVLTLSNEFELIDQDIIDGFMLNKLIINGEGPAYNSAQVGLLTMSKRLEKFRGEVAHFIEENIFKQVAIWNGFTTEGKRGQEEIIYPTIKWTDLELRDNSNKLQIMQSAQQQGSVSTQTFIETLGLDYDQEVERLRFENTAGFIATPDKDLGGMGGGYGAEGGMGGMGGMGGLGGGGGGDISDILGGLGGGGGEEAMGAEPMPGAEAGGEAPMPAMATSKGDIDKYRFASNIMNSIYKEQTEPHQNNINIRLANTKIKSNAHKLFLENIPVVTGRGKLGMLPEEPTIFVNNEWSISLDGGPFCCPLNGIASKLYKTAKKEPQPPKMLFSKLEQKLYSLILNMNIPFPFYAQYRAGPGLQYQLDGAFPSIKLGLEADSKTFHSSPEKIASDKQRDMNLAAQGWTILRFTEEEILEQPQDIANVVMTVVNRITTGNSNTI